MALKPEFAQDSNKNPLPIVRLTDSQNVDGTSASAQSAEINGYIVRIVSTTTALRVAIGANPTALSTDIVIPALGELWLPIEPGQRVAILGGIANISTAGI